MVKLMAMRFGGDTEGRLNPHSPLSLHAWISTRMVPLATSPTSSVSLQDCSKVAGSDWFNPEQLVILIWRLLFPLSKSLSQATVSELEVELYLYPVTKGPSRYSSLAMLFPISGGCWKTTFMRDQHKHSRKDVYIISFKSNTAGVLSVHVWYTTLYVMHILWYEHKLLSVA